MHVEITESHTARQIARKAELVFASLDFVVTTVKNEKATRIFSRLQMQSEYERPSITVSDLSSN